MLQHDDIAEDLHPWFTAMTAAVASGSIEAAAYLRRAGCGAEVEGAWAAVPSLGNVDMLEWLCKGARLDAALGVLALIQRWSGRSAALSAKLEEVVRWLDALAGQSTHDCFVVFAAAAGGELGLVRYLHEELGSELVPSVLSEAAGSGCEELVEWLAGRFGERDQAGEADRCHLSAALNGDLAKLQCLQRVGLRWGRKEMLGVVSGLVPLPAVQWMWGPSAPPLSRHLGEEALRVTEEAWLEARALEPAAWFTGQLESVS